MLAADAAIWIDSSASAEVESVTFTPRSGSPRTISAQVFRSLPVTVPGASIGNTPALQVFIRRHATLGATSIDRGGDTITVAVVKGRTAEALPVAEIVSEDAGGFLLRLI